MVELEIESIPSMNRFHSLRIVQLTGAFIATTDELVAMRNAIDAYLSKIVTVKA